MECGIVGLPGAGQTTLFNALTAGHASIVPGASKPNVGVAAVPDPRLALVARFVDTRKVTPATITLVDIPGIHACGGAA
ncbi:MAG: 50S ribosome-binding GTPase [Planctomycetes bacterium]|nr:50S ribosome-binding GTPase [Planctomycetota bacterium]